MRRISPRTLALMGAATLLVAAPGQAKLQAAARTAVTGTVYKYETTHFAIYYQTSGENAVYGSSTVDGNGVPVAIDSIGAYAERSWRLAVDTIKFKAPVGVAKTILYEQTVPTGKMPIEVGDAGVAASGAPYNSPWMGLTSDPSSDPNGLGCDMVIENDFLYDTTLKPIRDSSNQVSSGILYDFSTPADIHKGWKVAVSHEFFRTVEYGYEHKVYNTFLEMCAVWFEMRAYPHIYHHWIYLPKFIAYGYSGAFAASSYDVNNHGSFVRELSHVFGDTAIRKVWEYRAQHTASDDESVWFSAAMDSLGYSQATLLADYSVELANLLYDHPGVLNDSGLYVNQPYEISSFYHMTATDTGFMNQLPIEIGAFGFDGNTFYWDSIPPNMHVRVDSISSSTVGAGFVVHLPSHKIVQFAYKGKDVILPIDGSDTAISVLFVGGSNPPIIETRLTYAPVTGIASAKKLRAAFIPKIRYDYLGRPVSSDARGVVIESDGEKTVRSVKLK